jgi:type II secretory pathway component PulC
MKKVLVLAFLAGCAHGQAMHHEDPGTVGPEPTPIATAKPEVAPTPEPVPTVTKERHSTGTISRAALVAMLDAAPGRFLQHVVTEPRFVGGKFHGWTLASFFPGDERFADVDLQAGDVVLSVNGMPIEQPDQFIRVWDMLRTQHTLLVVIERDGHLRELRYDIRD